jgi:hypothetical protein
MLISLQDNMWHDQDIQMQRDRKTVLWKVLGKIATGDSTNGRNQAQNAECRESS